MAYFNLKQIQELEHLYKINLINSCSGFKSANLIGTKSTKGQENVAVFSSVTHIVAIRLYWAFFADQQR